MNKQVILGGGVIIGIVVGLVMTRPAVSPAPEEPPAKAPWESGMVAHIKEHGLLIGPEADGDIVVSQSGEKVHVVLAPRFIEKHGEEILPALGMTGAEAVFTPEGWNEFLESLHMALFDDDPHAEKGHDHGHEHDGHDHEH